MYAILLVTIYVCFKTRKVISVIHIQKYVSIRFLNSGFLFWEESICQEAKQALDIDICILNYKLGSTFYFDL